MRAAAGGKPQDAAARLPLRRAIAVFAGNGLEFYDFMTYAFFAVYIGKTFFPSGDPMLSLLASLGTFGVGFITRPLGALYFGTLADRIGRTPVMVTSFTLMGIGIATIVMTIFYALSSGVIFTVITEQLPPHLRAGAMSTIYAFAVAIFGGSTQFMETWLIRSTGSALAPAYYWMTAATAGLIAFALLPESAPIRQSS